MTSHTPGPWTLNGEVRRVGDTDHYCADICGPSDDGFWRGGVAYIQTADHLKHGMRIDEGKANAALIAAAPDLLAALKRLTNYSIKPTQADWQSADDAIAKAEGRQPASLSASQKEQTHV